MPQRRELGEQLGRDVLAGRERLDRLDPGFPRRLQQVLALADEEALPLALTPRGQQPPDQAKLRVVGRRDHRS
jgi:hypothetical protein